ncbi:MAG: YcxB family protein [Planctomycetota bacterium]
MIEASFRVGVDDVCAFSEYYAKHNPDSRRALLFVSLLIVGIVALIGGAFLLLGLVLVFSNDAIFPSTVIFMCILGLGIGAFIGFDFYRNGPKIHAQGTRKAYVRQPHSTQLGNKTLTINDSGIVIAGEHGRSEMTWRSIARIEETAAHIFLLVGPFHAIIIPKASLVGTSPEVVIQAIKPHMPNIT